MINGEAEHSGTELNTARVTSAELPLDPASTAATAATKVTPVLQTTSLPPSAMPSPARTSPTRSRSRTQRWSRSPRSAYATPSRAACSTSARAPGPRCAADDRAGRSRGYPQDARNGSRWSRTSPPATAESSSTALTRPRRASSQGTPPPACESQRPRRSPAQPRQPRRRATARVRWAAPRSPERPAEYQVIRTAGLGGRASPLRLALTRSRLPAPTCCRSGR